MRKKKYFKKKKTVYMGIDPGKTGGATLLLPRNKVEFMDWPSSNDFFFVSRAIRKWNETYNIAAALLEKVGAMPGQGSVSCFTFGENAGAWKMLLCSLDIKFQELTPQAWQKGLYHKSDGREPKERARNVATRMFGYDHFFGPRGGYKDGRGDSALMAYKIKLIWEGKV